MPTTGSGKWPYPNSSATPDVPADFLTLAQRIDKMSSGWTVCADATARAALVTNGDAYEGLTVYQIDTLTTYRYVGAAWVFVGQPATYAERASANLSTGATFQALDFAAPTGSAFTESTGVFTCTVAGYYKVTLAVTYAANATGIRGAQLAGPGSKTRSRIDNAVSGGIVHEMPIVWQGSVSVSDTITASGLQSSGGNLATSAEISFERLS